MVGKVLSAAAARCFWTIAPRFRIFSRQRSQRTINMGSRNLWTCFTNAFWNCSSYALLTMLLFHWLYGGVVMFIFLLLAIAGVVYEAQDVLLYHPDHPERARLLVITPAYYSLPYENVWLVTEDGVRLNGFFIKQQGELLSSAPTILFFHGNAGNIGDRLPHVQRLYNKSLCNVFLLEYRGYGRSEGHVSEQGLILDAQAALDMLLSRTDINPNKVVVLGVSLGGAVGTQLASLPSYREKIMATIIVNSFTSIADMGACMFHAWIARAPKWMFRNRFSSLDAIKDVTSPVLFVSGQRDLMVPPRMMRALCDACQARKFFFPVPNLGHNDTFQSPYYGEVVRDFLESVQGLHVPNQFSAIVQSVAGENQSHPVSLDGQMPSATPFLNGYQVENDNDDTSEHHSPHLPDWSGSEPMSGEAAAEGAQTMLV